MRKIVIYQAFTRLFGNRNTTRVVAGTLSQNGTGKFADFDTTTLRRLHHLGATHVWFTGVLRHATTTDYAAYGLPAQHAAVVKGKAGSPYAVCDYYDVCPDLATAVPQRMEEFVSLVQRTHKAGLGVVIDFVPNHVAREYHSLAKPATVVDLGAQDDTNKHFSPQNDFYYCVGEPFVAPVAGHYHEYPARATGNDCFCAAPALHDWYETAKLNYGIDYNDWSGQPSTHFAPRPPLWDKMTDILLFWASKGVDAFRCDMAAMVPAAFWQYAARRLRAVYPHIILIGEVYDKGQYRDYLHAGFDYLYDKVGMYDTLRAVLTGHATTEAITTAWQDVDDIRDRMLYFLENHDEQRLASSFFAGDAQRGIPAFLVAALLGSNPVLLYAGQEFGEAGMEEEGFSGHDGRTTIFDYWCVESIRRGYYARRALTATQRHIEQQYRHILTLARDEETVANGASFDLMYVNKHLLPQQYAFLRGNNMLVVANFAATAVRSAVFLPSHAFAHQHLAERTVAAVDRLTGNTFTLPLQRDKAVELPVPAHGGIVLTW